MLEVCLIGTGGSIPKPERWLASALLRHNGSSVVIDCGEGTQLALKSAGYPAGRIALILITHFHADHVSGLPGLLLAMSNEGRLDPVTIAGPRGLRHVVESLCVIAGNLPFQVNVLELPSEHFELPPEYLPEGRGSDAGLRVTSFPLYHSMMCLGYRISLPRAGKFDPERAKLTGIPVNLWGVLQRGESVSYGGTVYRPSDVMGAPRHGIDICYVTDTRPIPEIVPEVADADLLICESTFGDDKEERARKSRHMTATEAAIVASDAGVGRLWLTHYSPSVTDTAPCLESARRVFPTAEAGYDGMREIIGFPEEQRRI